MQRPSLSHSPEEFMASKLFSNERRMRALHLLFISLTDIHLNLKKIPRLGIAKEGSEFLLRLNSVFVVVELGNVNSWREIKPMSSSRGLHVFYLQVAANQHTFALQLWSPAQSTRFCKNTVEFSFYEGWIFLSHD